MLLEQPAFVLGLFYGFLLAQQFVFGFPLRLVFAKGERASLVTHVLIGTAMTTIPMTGLSIWTAFQMGDVGLRAVGGVATFAAGGAVTGALYWLFAGIGTPAQRRRRRIAQLDAQFD